MRKVFLETLPQKQNGNIDWKSSSGHIVDFIYDDYVGNFKILSYDSKSQFVKLLCENKIYYIKNNSLRYGYVAQLTGKITYDFLYNVGDIICDNNRNLKITGRFKDDTFKERYYEYQCNICGWNGGKIIESHLKSGHGCSCCSNRTVVQGINDIPTTAPWMVDYFQGGYDEAKKYTKCSRKRIIPICPDCKTVHNKQIPINSIYYNKGFSCIVCKDGYSYPEKFFYSFLKQLNCKFVMQFSSKNASWVKNYRYDFYLQDYNAIIETNGMQHYEESPRKNAYNRSLKEEKENDKEKRNLAISNGVLYFEIDCRYSNMEWIKKSILNSGILNILNIENLNIDWIKCEKFAVSNLSKFICNLKKENPKLTASKASIMTSLSIPTITSYWKIGTKLGWCNYNGNYKQIEMSKDELVIGIFNSAKEIVNIKQYNDFSIICIQAVCRNQRKTYKGYKFKYI